MDPKHEAEDWLGRTAVRHVRITEELVDAFVAISGDTQPIHVSDAAVRAAGFPARVVHGFLLGSLVSGVLGTELPGEPGMSQRVELSFHKPCFPGDEVLIALTVIEFFESVQTIISQVKIERTDGLVVATGRIQSGLR